MVVTSASAYVCLLGVLYAAVFTTTDDNLKGSNKTAIYTLTFYTCDVEQAGTEDVVNVTLTGCSRESVALQFDGEDAQGNLTIFSQGNTYINKKEVTDVGPIFQIFVERNEKKPNDGWKLGNVSVSYVNDMASFKVSDCLENEDKAWVKKGRSINRTDGSCPVLPCNISTSKPCLSKMTNGDLNETSLFSVGVILVIAACGLFVIIVNIVIVACLHEIVKRKQAVGQLSNNDITLQESLPIDTLHLPTNAVIQFGIQRGNLVSAVRASTDYSVPVDSVLVTRLVPQCRRLVSWTDNSVYGSSDFYSEDGKSGEADDDGDANEDCGTGYSTYPHLHV